MTDQAQEQSAAQQDAAPTRESLEQQFKAMLEGGQPQGQAKPTDGEQAQADDGESPSDPDAQEAAQAEVKKYRLPALEGDGEEELTADEIRAQRLMQKDYTRKTQEVAEQRKAIEAKAREVESAMTAKLDKLEVALASSARLIQSYEQQVDWEALQVADPAEYIRQREAQAQRVRAWNAMQQQADELKQERTKARQSEERQRLVEAIPEWLDPQRAKADIENLTAAAQQHYGLTVDDLDNAPSHKWLLMARDAAAYHELRAKAANAKAEVQKAPPLAKPGATKPGNPEALRAHRAIQRARETPSRDALTDAFKASLK